MSFLELCRKVISIDSSPVVGTKDICEYFADLSLMKGFNVDLQEDYLNGVDQANILIRPKEKVEGDEFLLITHLDTTDPGSYSLWTETMKNPYKASIHGDDLYGLGVASGKLDFLCKLCAAEKFVDKKLKRPFVLVGTYGELNSLAGVIKLIRKKMVKASQALVGEPTKMQLAHGGVGLTTMEAFVPFSEEEMNYHQEHNLAESSSSQSKVFPGKAAHGAFPQLGENAIIKMLEYLVSLPEGIAVMDLEGGVGYNTVPPSAILEIDIVGGFKETVVPKLNKVLECLRQLEKQFQEFKQEGFEPNTSTMNLGQIRTFRDHIKLVGSCRILPSVPQESYEMWLRELKKACEEVGANFRVSADKKPFMTAKDSDFVKSLQEEAQSLGLEGDLVKTTVCTEASVLSHWGVECVVFGPGAGAGNIHAPNESISMKSLNKAIEFYEKVIEKNCL